MKKLLLILICCFCLLGGFAQNNGSETRISGFIVSNIDETSLSFATIVNLANNKATISNSEGYFEIELGSLSDTLLVSYIGFKSLYLTQLDPDQESTYQLESMEYQLEAVSVKPKDYSYLFDLIEECRLNTPDSRSDYKAYYQLKSYINNQQVELVESFYNAEVSAYDLLSLQLKNGRVGLKEVGQSFFGSLESSKPILKHKLMREVDFFPENPIAEKPGRMKKHYYLELQQSYVNQEGDSIYQLYLFPKKKRSKRFDCKLWINATDLVFLKVILEGFDLEDYPIMPSYAKDKLENRDLRITKTFKQLGGDVYFEHIDFSYNFLYKKFDGKDFTVSTKAVIFAYEKDSAFVLPRWKGFANQLNDYQALGALPYNPFFWKFNDELKLNDAIDSNAIFMADPRTVSNQNFRKKASSLTELFSYRNEEWSLKRLFFKELPKQTAYKEGEGDYQLAGSFYLDWNHYKDSTDILIRSLFDSYESYYRYQLDARAFCFMNIYFDLWEVEKRKLENLLTSRRLSMDAVWDAYEKSSDAAKETVLDYEKEVERGRNPERFYEWNQRIKEELGVDNLKVYGIELNQ